MNKIYLAGKITGDPNYKEKFGRVAGDLRRKGYSVMNPAALPDGFDYEDYMRVCTAMIDVCEAVCFMPDWKDSYGAKYEYGHAIAAGKRVVFLNEQGCFDYTHNFTPEEPEDTENA